MGKRFCSSTSDFHHIFSTESGVIPGPVVRGQKNPLHFRLALRLQKTRKERGLSRRQLAEIAEVAASSISYIENGNPGARAPGIDTVERLAAALGVSACWLAYGDE